MATEVKIPEISEGVTEGTVISLLVTKGDMVERDQSLLELETDKAVVAVPSPAAGTVADIVVNEGDTVAVGAVILHLETAGMVVADQPATARDDGAEPAEAAAEVPEPAPEKEPEEKTARKPTVEPAGSPEPQPEPQDEAPERVVAESSEGKTEPDALAPAAPSVRRLARELGADINQVPGTGPHGRISAEDLRAFVKGILTSSGDAGAVGAGKSTPLPDFTRWGPVEREQLNKVREVTARAMTQAWLTAPQVTQYDKADITEVEAFRQSANARRREGEAKLTMTSILLWFAAAALREFPQFNTSLDWERRELVKKLYIHIGVAVDTPHGLLVPVIRDVDHKGLQQLAAELTELAGRTRERRVKPDELEGGTFTISNLGGIGGTAFSPIVYTPQVAILGVSQASREPVWQDGQFVPRLLMPLSLTYDHRVIDGADGARFLRWICQVLRQPLMLNLKG